METAKPTPITRASRLKAYFNNKKQNWYKLVPLMFRLNWWRAANGQRYFTVVPKSTFKRIHLHSLDFYDLLKRVDRDDKAALKAIGKGKQQKPDKANKAMPFTKGAAGVGKIDMVHWWREHCDVKAFERGNKSFANIIYTDGYSVSISMEKPPLTMEMPEDRYAEIRKKLDHNEYATIQSFDPGECLKMAGVSLNVQTGEESHIKLTKRD